MRPHLPAALALVATAALLSPAAVPAAAHHNTCHNQPPPQDVYVVLAGVDTGILGSGAVVCVEDVYVERKPAPSGAGTVVQVRHCEGSTCSVLLGPTGAGAGPGALTCAWVGGQDVCARLRLP